MDSRGPRVPTPSAWPRVCYTPACETDRHGHHPERGREHRARRWRRSPGPTKSSSSTRRAPTTPSRSRRRCATRVEVRDWPGYSAQKNFAAERRDNDWILSLDADERVTPALAQPRSASPVQRGPRARGYRVSRVTPLPGTLDAQHRLVSGLSAAPLRSPLRAVERRARPRVGRAATGSRDSCGTTSSTSPTATSATTSPRSIATRRCGRTVARSRAVAPIRSRIALHPPVGVPAQLHPARRLHGRRRRVPGVGAELVLRVPEAGEALGTAARLARPRIRCASARQTRRVERDPHRSAPARARAAADDVLPPHRHRRTWRGGQNQVLVTVLGLRALGHRTMLVAHPNGELRQRAKEGLELIAARAEDRDGPRAPRGGCRG